VDNLNASGSRGWAAADACKSVTTSQKVGGAGGCEAAIAKLGLRRPSLMDNSDA